MGTIIWGLTDVLMGGSLFSLLQIPNCPVFIILQMVEATGGPELARTVLSPLLIKDAIDFLSFILNDEEKKLWWSLGETWNKSR